MAERQDEELQRYLDGKSPLSARYREQSRETPSPELDAAVLDYARAQARRPRSRWRRFTLPLAAAATLVLAVNLVWLQRERAVPEIPVAQEAPGAEHASRPTAPPPAAAAQRAEALAARRADSEREDRERAAETGRAQSAAAPPPPPEPRQRMLQSAPDGSRSEESLAGAPLRKSEAPRRQAAPSADAFVAPPAAAPVAIAAEPEEVEAQARALARLLRDGDLATLRARYDAAGLEPAMLDTAAETLRALPPEAAQAPRLLDGEVWAVDYADADGRVRCTARLQRRGAGWTLLGLELRR